jgi:hypothetical protein
VPKKPVKNEQRLTADVDSPAETRNRAPAATIPSPQAAPQLDLNGAIQMVKDMDRERPRTTEDRLREAGASSNSFEAKTGQAIERASREDCHTKYVSEDTNLLKLIPLAIETIGGKGCKW